MAAATTENRCLYYSFMVPSCRCSLQSAAAAADADASSSETASLPGVSSSWSVSSASDAEVVAHDWVVDDKVADNVFRLKETLSSRMYMRAKKRSDGFPVLSGTAELKSGFGVATDLGSIFVSPCLTRPSIFIVFSCIAPVARASSYSACGHVISVVSASVLTAAIGKSSHT